MVTALLLVVGAVLFAVAVLRFAWIGACYAYLGLLRAAKAALEWVQGRDSAR